MKKVNGFSFSAKSVFCVCFALCTSLLAAQSGVKNDSTLNVSRPPVESIKIEKNTNNTSSEFFIIDDKPVTKQEYLEYLRDKDAKKEAPKTSN